MAVFRVAEREELDVTPVDAWAMLKDVAAVFASIPGVRYVADRGGDNHELHTRLSAGGLAADFSGVANVKFDDPEHRVHIAMRGRDGSHLTRARASVQVVVLEGSHGALIDVNAEVDLAGPLALSAPLARRAAASLLTGFLDALARRCASVEGTR